MAQIDRFYVRAEDKDPAHHYRWLNYNERHIRDKVYHEGWEICTFDKPENPLAVIPGSAEASSGASGVIRQRGDVVLARMLREQYEKTVKARVREANERTESSLDTMVASANERMHRESRNAGLAAHAKALVFREADENA